MSQQGTFACVINCMDGRVQDAVKNHIKEHAGVDYVDMVTEPGPNKILADNPSTGSGQIIIENIKKRVEISVKHHGAKVVAIVGHHGCAGNPTEKEEQIEHLKLTQKTVESFGLGVDVLLLWVEGDWKTVQRV